LSPGVAKLGACDDFGILVVDQAAAQLEQPEPLVFGNSHHLADGVHGHQRRIVGNEIDLAFFQGLLER
jgi:hypothetical protein